MGAETAVRKKVAFKPLKERVFVSYSEEQDRTSGGLYIPDAAKEKPSGKVELLVAT
jgi:chaperonin GroES